SDELRPSEKGNVPSYCELRETDTGWCKTRRSAGRAAHAGRAVRKFAHCEGHWRFHSRHSAGTCRPGDRMSNCVVGSGGLRLPCSIVAEHSVEGCDHFSHDGDDDDLGFFVGVGKAIVEGLEGGTVSACAEGGHVEDITDRHPTTVDAAV